MAKKEIREKPKLEQVEVDNFVILHDGIKGVIGNKLIGIAKIGDKLTLHLTEELTSSEKTNVEAVIGEPVEA